MILSLKSPIKTGPIWKGYGVKNKGGLMTFHNNLNVNVNVLYRVIQEKSAKF
jgi:hypothetical protein